MVRDVTREVLHHWITNPRAARVQRATVRQTIRDISHLDDRGPNWELDPPCWLLNDDVVPAIGQTLTRTFAGEQVTFRRRGAAAENGYVQLTSRGVDGTQYRAVSTWWSLYGWSEHEAWAVEQLRLVADSTRARRSDSNAELLVIEHQCDANSVEGRLNTCVPWQCLPANTVRGNTVRLSCRARLQLADGRIVYTHICGHGRIPAEQGCRRVILNAEAAAAGALPEAPPQPSTPAAWPRPEPCTGDIEWLHNDIPPRPRLPDEFAGRSSRYRHRRQQADAAEAQRRAELFRQQDPRYQRYLNSPIARAVDAAAVWTAATAARATRGIRILWQRARVRRPVPDFADDLPPKLDSGRGDSAIRQQLRSDLAFNAASVGSPQAMPASPLGRRRAAIRYAAISPDRGATPLQPPLQRLQRQQPADSGQPASGERPPARRAARSLRPALDAAPGSTAAAAAAAAAAGGPLPMQSGVWWNTNFGA